MLTALNLINTRFQPGDAQPILIPETVSTVYPLPGELETVETVQTQNVTTDTRLKPGVNEIGHCFVISVQLKLGFVSMPTRQSICTRA
ncbi:MAG: hypothetical protein ABI596_00490 [Pyrinomonadaceae bacterium]